MGQDVAGATHPFSTYKVGLAVKVLSLLASALVHNTAINKPSGPVQHDTNPLARGKLDIAKVCNVLLPHTQTNNATNKVTPFLAHITTWGVAPRHSARSAHTAHLHQWPFG